MPAQGDRAIMSDTTAKPKTPRTTANILTTVDGAWS
jgi:hypothetical protein